MQTFFKAAIAVVLGLVCVVIGSVGGCTATVMAGSLPVVPRIPVIVGAIAGAALGLVGGISLTRSLFRQDK